MTCIVGFRDFTNNKVYIGGDSYSVTSSLEYHVMDNDKVFERQGLIFGYTSTWRFGQLVQYTMEYPPRISDTNSMEYLCRQWVPALLACLQDNGHVGTGTQEDHDGKLQSGQALIGLDGKLFFLNSDFSILQPSNGTFAVGCGADFALGAMAVLLDTKLKPEDKVRKCIEASSTLSGGVGGPITVLSA